MSRPSKTHMALLLAALEILGIYNAEAGTLKVMNPNEKAAAIHCLVSKGLIIPLAEENWYQISHERLNKAIEESSNGYLDATEILDLLRIVVGSGVNIREVDLLNAKLGTQDYTIER